MNIITELKEELVYMRKVLSKVKRPTRRKIIKQRSFMDATLQADLQAVADKDAATFKVVQEVPPTVPVVETTQFAPGVPPVVQP